MCYAIPGKVVELKENIVVLDYFGEHRNVLNKFIEVKIGEYVYAQGGLLIDKIAEEDAIEILSFWEERFFELKKTDNKLTETRNVRESSDSLLSVLQKVNLNKKLEREEILALLKTGKREELKLIYETANNIRRKELGNACCVHGIIEFSNYCRNNCFYCGIRKDKNIERYRMSPNEIVEAAKYAVKELGFKALVLQSGEDFWFDDEKLVEIIEEIKKLNILIFLSVGVRSELSYKRFYEAGAKAVLLRFETSNEKSFHKLRPNTNFNQRIELIKHLKKIGYIVATGFLIGLPEETEEDIINNILLTKSLNTDMYSFGPLIPAKCTPLENQSIVDKDTVLKTIAITRFIDRKSKVLVTSALETLDTSAKKEGLMAGANSLMVNITPAKYKSLYAIYPNKAGNNKDIEDSIRDTLDLLYSLGRAPTDLGV